MKVVDLSTDVSGRFAAKLFAMADVDVARPRDAQDDAQPQVEDFLTLYLDAGKRVVPIDCDGNLSRLLADADLVFTSFDCGKYTGFASRGLQLSRQCIQVTTSSFGCTGPYSSFRGGPLADWAASGYLALTGEPGKEPLIGPETLCAYAGGYTAALAAEAALRERRMSGEGQHVDIGTMEAMLGLHQSTFAALAAGFIRQRTGRYAEIYPLVVRPCKDGYVSLGVVTDEDFDRLAIAFNMPDLASEDRFATREARWTNRDELDQELAKFLDYHAADEVVAVLQANAVASTKVADIRQVLANPQLRYREFWTSPYCASDACMPGNPVPASTAFARSSDPLESEPRRRLFDGERASKHLPLAGVRVLDFTAFWAGPSATAFLADLGAEVIWVERPRSRIDFDAHVANPGVIAQYLYHQKLNRHKRSVVLDLGTAAGLQTARQLAGSVDILVENFRAGVASRLGLAPSEVCAANPGLIYISLSGFGSGGPWGDWRSFGPNIEAASSIMDRTGYSDGEPMRLGHTLPDGIGGVVGALAALRGLREREERGHGGWFDLSQLESYVALSGEDVLAASRGNKSFPRVANRSRTGAIQGVFPCKGHDQWIAIRLTGASDVERFVSATGLKLPSATAAYGNDDELHRMIRAVTVSQEKGALTQLLQRTGLEVFPALTPPELMDDPHLAARGYFYSLCVGDRRYLLPGTPVHGERALADPVGRAPRFDEHTRHILQWLDGNATADADADADAD